jgi:hypothetical protein
MGLTGGGRFTERSGMGCAGGAWCMVTMIALAGFLPAHWYECGVLASK